MGDDSLLGGLGTLIVAGAVLGAMNRGSRSTRTVYKDRPIRHRTMKRKLARRFI